MALSARRALLTSSSLGATYVNALRTNVRRRGGHPWGRPLQRQRHSYTGIASSGMAGPLYVRGLIRSRWRHVISMISMSIGGLTKLAGTLQKTQAATTKANLSMDLAANPTLATFTQPFPGSGVQGTNMASELQKNTLCIQGAPGHHYGRHAIRTLECKVERHMRSLYLHMPWPVEQSVTLWYQRERGDNLPPSSSSL